MKIKPASDAKNCEKCGSPNTTVVRRGEDMRNKGWYCLDCKHFDAAIGREVLIKPEFYS